MGIHRLKLISVRNHKNTEFYFSPGVTVIWGENGSGKTAILEAINTLSFGRSFKTNRQRELINTEKDELFIHGEFFTDSQEDKIDATVSKISGQTIKINGKTTHSRKDLLGRNVVVVLSPEEQEITKGSPAARRKFFDRIFSVVSPKYLKTLQNYNRTLKQRNMALLQIRDGTIKRDGLETWTKPLVSSGKKLWNLRSGLINNFKTQQTKVSSRYGKGIKMTITYPVHGKTENQYLEKIKETINQDLALCRTGYGPHRDDMILNWSDRNIKTFGSQGEHKLCLVILKLSELFFIKENTGAAPTLLLDDLFAKLDLDRCKNIVRLLREFEEDSKEAVQTVITTTDLINIEHSGLMSENRDHRTYHLER